MRPWPPPARPPQTSTGSRNPCASLSLSSLLFHFRPLLLRPQAAHEVHDVPDLLIAQLAFERRHIFLGPLADAGKNSRGARSVQPHRGIGEIRRRRAGKIAP